MTRVFRLKDIACPNKAEEIKERIQEIKYVKTVSVDFFSERLVIDAPKKEFEEIIDKAKKICNEVDPYVIFSGAKNNIKP